MGAGFHDAVGVLNADVRRYHSGDGEGHGYSVVVVGVDDCTLRDRWMDGQGCQAVSLKLTPIRERPSARALILSDSLTRMWPMFSMVVVESA